MVRRGEGGVIIYNIRIFGEGGGILCNVSVDFSRSSANTPPPLPSRPVKVYLRGTAADKRSRGRGDGGCEGLKRGQRVDACLRDADRRVLADKILPQKVQRNCFS